MAELNIPDSFLNEFCCTLCKCDLSFAPIHVLPNGKSICSDCSLWADEQPCCRNLTLEALLSKFSFLCKFKEHGCTERILFGHTKEHQAKCGYRTFICPALPNGACSWQGSVIDIPDHFNKNHPDLTKTTAEFKLDVNQDQQGILMCTFDNVPIIVKYVYSTATSKLLYDLRCIMLNVQETSCMIRLSNDSDGDFNCNMKIGECLLYNDNFYNMQGARVLILNKYLEILNNPACVMIMVDVTVTNGAPTGQSIKAAVDYEMLQSLRCSRCVGYLLPPIFSGEKGVVCCYCHKKFGDSNPVQDVKLIEYVAKAKFPCRWRGCEFAGVGGDTVREHEEACQFQILKCLACRHDYMRQYAKSHAVDSEHEYFCSSSYVYKVLRDKEYKKMFAFKSNEIIFIEHTIDYFYGDYRQFEHYFRMEVIGTCPDITVKVEFEHTHCKIKSKTYTMSASDKSIRILESEFLNCFKQYEELTVTLTV